MILRGQESQVALTAARQQYSQGAVDFLTVNSAEILLPQAQNDLAAVDVQIASGLVDLYRALGGGWQAAEATVPPDRPESVRQRVLQPE